MLNQFITKHFSDLNTSQLKWLWLTVLAIALDFISKQLAESLLEYAQPIYILPVFDLTLLYNRGAAFSFLANEGGWQRWFFTAIAFCVSAVMSVWLMKLKPSEKFLSAALALVIGGALGNVYDRLVYGHVIDFIHVHWDQYYFPAFNIADSAITLGAAMLLYESIFMQNKKA